MTSPAPEQQLRTFIARFEPGHQKLIRAARKSLQRRYPAAHEMVYDNYNFFVIGYSPTERPLDAPLSIAAGANGVSLCFLHGKGLPDPKKLLLGSGNQTRFLRLESAATLGQRDVQALVTAAVARARAPFRTTGRGRLIIRSVSAKQRPRRRVQKSA